MEYTQVGNDIVGLNPSDRHGASVSMSDNGRTVAIGSDINSTYNTSNGYVRVFALSTNKSETVSL